MNGLGPLDRRVLREIIVSQFFATVGDKQVRDLDLFMDKAEVNSFSYKGHNYCDSRANPPATYRPLRLEHRKSFDAFLKIYEGLEMEMASLSSLLTRLFRKCNSLRDMQEILPDGLKPLFLQAPAPDPAPEDYMTQYLTQQDIDEIHEENREAILKVKVRLMRDEVFK